MEKEKLIESLASETKEDIITYLIDEGYGTYARRLDAYKFVIADKYRGSYISVAAMFPDYGEIVLNPSMINTVKMAVDPNSVNDPRTRQLALNDKRTPEDKMMQQLSVLIRHELLHFMLVHEKRFIEHLKKIDPAWEHAYKTMSAHRLANFAMDYDISNEGYDAHDKEVVRLMTLNNEVVGGLIAEDDHPEWGKKTMEEMYDILKKEHDENMKKKANQPQTVVNVNKATHSQDYTDMYNKIMKLFDDQKFTDADLDTVLDAAMNDLDVLDPQLGNILLKQGE